MQTDMSAGSINSPFLEKKIAFPGNYFIVHRLFTGLNYRQLNNKLKHAIKLDKAVQSCRFRKQLPSPPPPHTHTVILYITIIKKYAVYNSK